MVVEGGAPPLYDGPEHRWEVPPAAVSVSFFMLLVTLFVVVVEVALFLFDLLYYGYVRPTTARGFAATGIALLVVANLKAAALAVSRDANEALKGIIQVVLKRLWTLHFWLNPLGLFSLGLFLLAVPRPQPPFYYMAYGVMLWQVGSGLLARKAVPLRGATQEMARVAKASHHQPAVYVVLVLLVIAGFVDSLFP